MPIMDGFEATTEIRSFLQQTSATQPKIVACTGHIEEEFIKKAWLHGIDEVVPKPVKIEVIAQILKESI